MIYIIMYSTYLPMFSQGTSVVSSDRPAYISKVRYTSTRRGKAINLIDTTLHKQVNPEYLYRYFVFISLFSDISSNTF